MPIVLWTLPDVFPMQPSFSISSVHLNPHFMQSEALPSPCGPAFTSQNLLSALFLWGNSAEHAAAAQVQRDSQHVRSVTLQLLAMSPTVPTPGHVVHEDNSSCLHPLFRQGSIFTSNMLKLALPEELLLQQ